MRVAIIGARRVRHGLGPYLARFAAEAGAELCAVVGTTMESSEEAVRQIESATGQAPAGVTDIEGVVNASAEALIIASPHSSHRDWLLVAARHGMHALCEKPLLWGVAQPAQEALRIAELFADKGRLLRTVTQWPYALEAYAELYPEQAATPISFFMQQPPRTTGFAALLDCLSHPASLLARLPRGASPDAGDEGARDPALSAITFLDGGPDATRWNIRCDLGSGPDALRVRLVLDSAPDEGRRTTFGFDGDLVTRVVDPSDYSMTLSDGERSIPLPDPTERLVRSFLHEASLDRPHAMDPEVTFGMPFLEQIVDAACAHYGVPRP